MHSQAAALINGRFSDVSGARVIDR